MGSGNTNGNSSSVSCLPSPVQQIKENTVTGLIADNQKNYHLLFNTSKSKETIPISSYYIFGMYIPL